MGDRRGSGHHGAVVLHCSFSLSLKGRLTENAIPKDEDKVQEGILEEIIVVLGVVGSILLACAKVPYAASAVLLFSVCSRCHSRSIQVEGPVAGDWKVQWK